MNISSPVTVNEGASVNLLCLAVGRPEPTVTWRQLRGEDHPWLLPHSSSWDPRFPISLTRTLGFPFPSLLISVILVMP